MEPEPLIKKASRLSIDLERRLFVVQLWPINVSAGCLIGELRVFGKAPALLKAKFCCPEALPKAGWVLKAERVVQRAEVSGSMVPSSFPCADLPVGL